MFKICMLVIYCFCLHCQSLYSYVDLYNPSIQAPKVLSYFTIYTLVDQNICLLSRSVYTTTTRELFIFCHASRNTAPSIRVYLFLCMLLWLQLLGYFFPSTYTFLTYTHQYIECSRLTNPQYVFVSIV